MDAVFDSFAVLNHLSCSREDTDDALHGHKSGFAKRHDMTHDHCARAPYPVGSSSNNARYAWKSYHFLMSDIL